MTTISTYPEQNHPAVDSDAIRAAIRANPRKMTIQLARELGVPEVEIIRAMPAEQVHELKSDAWAQIVERLPAFGAMHVVVSSPSVTMECEGQFGNISRLHGFLNVQSGTLDMHIRLDGIDAVFAVEKPGHLNGVKVQSLQFFSLEGHAAFKAFLGFGLEPISPQRLALYEALIADFKIA